MTQKQLAGKVGVTDVTISRYENGEREPSFTEFIKLCEVLGMNVDDFIERSGENDE